MKINIVQATESDAEGLTQIAIAAKSYWNYPEEYLNLWADDLTITPAYIQENTVLKAVNERGDIMGVGAIAFSKTFNAYEIGHLWVSPSHIGCGVGHQLIKALINFAQKKGINQLYCIADPNAQGFYEKERFVCIGKQESEPKGRFLPVLVKKIT